MSANDISEYSHGDMPWMIAEDNDDLEYEYVFYRDCKYSVGSMMEKYQIKTHPKFDKELDKLTDKCLSLKSDFERLKKVLLFDLKRG